MRLAFVLLGTATILLVTIFSERPMATTVLPLTVVPECSRVPYLCAVRDGSMSFEANDANKVNDSIKMLAGTYYGYVSLESQRTGDHFIIYDLTILAPSESIDDLMRDIGRLAVKIDHKKMSTTDLTYKAIETDNQLVGRMVLKAKYEAVTSQPIPNREAMEAEARVRTEIDSLRTFLNALLHGRLHRTLHLYFYQRI